MPYLIWVISSFIFYVIVPLVTKVLKALGIGSVMYVGINLVMGEVDSYITSQLGSVAADMRGILGLAKVDVAINILLSAVTTRLTLSGVSQLNGRKKDFVLKA